MTAAVRLGANQYGKAEVRIVKVTRDTARHEIEDLNVTSQLRGDFTATHLTGDNALVVATDTQKNTIYGLAREHGIGSPEDFLLLLGRHFTGASTGSRAGAGRPSSTSGTGSTATTTPSCATAARRAPRCSTSQDGAGDDRLAASPTWWC